MKIIEGVKGSKARVNDDKTVDYCLIEKALPQQEYGEYAFLSEVSLEKSNDSDPMYSLVRLVDLIEDAKYDDDATFDSFDKNSIVINEATGQLFFSSELLKNKEFREKYFDYSVEVDLKSDVLDMAKDAIKNVNGEDEAKKKLELSTYVINQVADAALSYVEWQHLCTCFDEIEQDMSAYPEYYQENK